MRNEMTLGDVVARIERVMDCTDCRPMALDAMPNIADVIASRSESRDGFADAQTAVVFRGADGRIAAFTEWADTTGHGCQCGASFEWFASVNDAVLMGLTDDDRDWLTPDPETT